MSRPRWLHVLIAALLAHTSSTTVGPNGGSQYTHWATMLTEDLMDAYLPTVPPSSTRAGGYSAAGTDVLVKPRFFRIDTIDLPSGQMHVKMWLRMMWTDKRLSWDPAAYGNITYVNLHAHGFGSLETSQIWVPDITAYNAAEGLMHTFDPALATVNSDGFVYWSRPGILRVNCRFSGLVKFPFDDALSCPIEMGGWMTSGEHQGVYMDNSTCDSAQPLQQEEVSMTTYQEYKIIRVACGSQSYYYPSAPNIPYPVVQFRVFLKRSHSWYVHNYIVPIISITIISFGVFYMSFEVGERLGFGITTLLTVELIKSTLTAMLPICDEFLWINLFLYLHVFYTVLPLLISCVVLGMSYIESITLIDEIETFRDELLLWLKAPRWCCNLSSRWQQKGPKIGAKSASTNEQQTSSCETTYPSGQLDSPSLLRKRNTFHRLTSGIDSIVHARSASSLVEPEQRLEGTATRNASADNSSTGPANPSGDERSNWRRAQRKSSKMAKMYNSAVVDEYDKMGRTRATLVKGRSISRAAGLAADDISKLLFYESVFFRLDSDGNGFVTFDEVGGFLGFTAVTLTPEEREVKMLSVDASSKLDGQLDRTEFLDLCTDVLWNYDIEHLEQATDNYINCKEVLVNRANKQWKRIAKRVDGFFGVWVPISYAVIMCTMFSMDWTDNYEGAMNSNDEAPTYLEMNAPGWVNVGLRPELVALFATAVAAFGIVLLITFLNRLMAERTRIRLTRKMAESALKRAQTLEQARREEESHQTPTSKSVSFRGVPAQGEGHEDFSESTTQLFVQSRHRISRQPTRGASAPNAPAHTRSPAVFETVSPIP